jgi:PASTA domain
VSRTFAIARAEQFILFGRLAHKTYGAADFRVRATASSGLPVLFTARGKCTVRGARVHLTGAGFCELTASQRGNANYAAADTVSHRFSIGRAPCKVPNVVGKQLTSAERSIAAGHCRTGNVGYAYSRERKRGIVISQGRRPGRVLLARSKVDLVVSRGRRG